MDERRWAAREELGDVGGPFDGDLGEPAEVPGHLVAERPERLLDELRTGPERDPVAVADPGEVTAVLEPGVAPVLHVQPRQAVHDRRHRVHEVVVARTREATARRLEVLEQHHVPALVVETRRNAPSGRVPVRPSPRRGRSEPRRCRVRPCRRSCAVVRRTARASGTPKADRRRRRRSGDRGGRDPSSRSGRRARRRRRRHDRAPRTAIRVSRPPTSSGIVGAAMRRESGTKLVRRMR